jgi:uncharacterized protein related to proFAR isomerase
MKTDFKGIEEGDSEFGDIERDIENLESEEDLNLLTKKILDIGIQNLPITVLNAVMMNRELTDSIREKTEEIERDRKEKAVYMEFGITKGEMEKRIEDARKMMELKKNIDAKLMESGVLTVKTKVNDERGRKPSRKLVKNLVKIFANNGGKMEKNDIVYKLRDIGYTAEDITLNLYVNWAINWGILNNVSGEFVINKNAVKELYGL